MRVWKQFLVIDENPPLFLSSAVFKANDSLPIDDKGPRPALAAQKDAVGRANRFQPIPQDDVGAPLFHTDVRRDNQNLHFSSIELSRLFAQLREICVSAGSYVLQDEGQDNGFLATELTETVGLPGCVAQGEIRSQLPFLGAIHLAKIVAR